MRVPNYKIQEKIQNLEAFVNYNNTISAEYSGDVYSIVHWRTTILEYNTRTKQIEWLQAGYISQTTSALVGRILRSLPLSSVSEYLDCLDHDIPLKRRLIRMVPVR